MDKEISRGVFFLKENDKILGELINRIGHCKLRPSRDYFGSLVRTIISQQLSEKAANAIFIKLLNELNCKLTPTSVMNLSGQQFIKSGVSKQKRAYLIELAAAFKNGKVRLRAFSEEDNERLISYLTTFRGIGRWSAEMFLIFCLNRPNILPLDDVGFKKALMLRYGLPKRPNDLVIKRISKNWGSYMSIAVWYLWQSVNGD